MEDMHIHSTFSDGRDTLADNLVVARARGLQRVGCVDHVRYDTDWLPEFVKTVQHQRLRHPRMQILAGVEAKLVDTGGSIDAPKRLYGVDRIYIADHQLPTPVGPRKPQWVRRALRDRSLTPEQVLWMLVSATTAAIAAARRPVVVAHLFSLLPKVGLREDEVTDAMLGRLVAAAVNHGAWVELDERWRCPGPRVARAFVQAGVPVVLSTDSHIADAIGQYRWAPYCLDTARCGPRATAEVAA